MRPEINFTAGFTAPSTDAAVDGHGTIMVLCLACIYPIEFVQAREMRKLIGEEARVRRRSGTTQLIVYAAVKESNSAESVEPATGQNQLNQQLGRISSISNWAEPFEAAAHQN